MNSSTFIVISCVSYGTLKSNTLRQALSLFQDTFHTFSLSVLHNLLYTLLLKSNVEKFIFVVDNFSFFKRLLLHKF